MYLVMFSSLSSCAVYWHQNALNLEFGLPLGVLASAASISGLSFADFFVRKSGHESVFVWLLCVVFIATIIMTIIDM